MDSKKTKFFVFFGVFILFILLIIGLKRTAIAAVFIGFIIYMFFSGELIKSMFFSLIIGLLFLASMPIFNNVLSMRIENRGTRLEGSVQEIVESGQI